MTADSSIMRLSLAGEAEVYPTPSAGSQPEAIALNGRDMWFTEWATGRVGPITAEGANSR